VDDVRVSGKCTGSAVVVDMKIAGRRFKPGWWAVALTAGGMTLFIALGLWQLERAILKESIEGRFQQRLTEPYRTIVPDDLAGGDPVGIEYRKLVLQGSFDNSRNLLVDNQLHRGRAGYHVLTPLQLEGSDWIVLVNRGWAPWGESRDNPSAVSVPFSAGGVAGIAYFPSEPAFQMGVVTLSSVWPQPVPYQLIPYIEVDALQATFEGRLLPWVLWLSPEQQGYYVRDWKPVWMRPEKSRAYAVQWFAFALVALVFFITMNLRKIE
jgi:surfeit locus 1 family protein